jgi:hypothetical protein
MFYCDVVSSNFAKGVPKSIRKTTFLTYNKIYTLENGGKFIN